MDYLELTPDNLENEHICCAIADKKHQLGVDEKKRWLAARILEGHMFRKLDAKGKVFIEYAPLESAWVPVVGERYLYIYCHWVAGSFKGKGHGAALLTACVEDAKRRGLSGVCAITAKKKKPFLSDAKFLGKFGFKTVDRAGEYELMALSFDGAPPRFAESAKRMRIDSNALTIYYSPQCPYARDCAQQCAAYCAREGIELRVEPVDTIEKAKAMPCVFNNWAMFRDGVFVGTHLLNEGLLKKLLG